MDYEVVMNNTVRIGMKAPDFEALTTAGNIKLSNYIGKWVVLFSHPGDFTPVCTTEFISFQKMIKFFDERNACLLGLSIDSNASHLAWLDNIYANTGTKITFPIIADKNMAVARKYGMIAPDVSTTETVRNVYIIDDKQIIRAILIYPLTTGRYIPEVIRIIDALQISDTQKVVTPANWIPGSSVIVPSPKTFANIEKNENNPELECIDWYLCFKKNKERINNKRTEEKVDNNREVK